MAPAMKGNMEGFFVNVCQGIFSLLPKKMRLIKPIRGHAAKNIQITEDI
jgi:hypothetical protein